ncbi:hypothetical protein BDZ94DRAFT_1247985 [Collybia nuda]|uniref:Uncharacterized protein n=1 Tax=Collybia nuda TaxID=64659 RepID=A0A9P5YDB2_9AGAR|nr:hypothetical protein BDZ94DRAFT_1247985 [Collybia nuda]
MYDHQNFTYLSSLPTSGTVLYRPHEPPPTNMVPEPYLTTSSPQEQATLDSTYEAKGGSSSVTHASRVSTPVHTSVHQSGHAQISTKSVEASSIGRGQLVCVTPREYERYSRKKLPKIETDEYMIPPVTRSFSPTGSPATWTSYVHPEGAPYFYDETRRILTDFNLYDDKEYQRAEHFISEIMNLMPGHGIVWPHDYEDSVLVLEPRNSGNVGYYFADHSQRVVFWLEECDIVWDMKEVKVELKSSHIGRLVRSYYWLHNELFPHNLKLSSAVIDEISDILVHAVGDSLTSSVCLSPYGLDTLQNMLRLLREIEEQCKTEYWAGSACVVYRFMGTIAEQQFLNLHGELGARLSRDQSIHPDLKKTRFFKCLSPFLLFAPTSYLRKLHETSVDSLVNKPSWTNIKEQLTEEWKDSALFATVLLNANVAFLAIQSVDQAERTYAQRASYFSVLASVGSIILGLLLTRQHQHIFNMEFLANRGVSALGFETLALMYSLPYVFLMWGTFLFLAAFSFMCYTSNDNPTYFLMSIGWFTLILLLLWCASASFETQAYFYPLPTRIWLKFRGKYEGWRVRLRKKSFRANRLKDGLECIETGERQLESRFDSP